MALLKLSGLVTKISGKIGGSILGTGGSGAYIKQNSFSQQPNSLLQQNNRVLIYEASQLWRSLTVAQKALWSAEAVNYPYVNRVGDTVEYTGYSLMLWCNNNLRQLGLPLLDVPGTYVAPVIPTISLLSFSGISMNLLYSGNSTDNAFIIYATPPMAENALPKLSDYRKISVLTSTLVTDTFNMVSDYDALFPNIEIGQRVYVYIKAINKNTGAPAGQTNVETRLYT